MVKNTLDLSIIIPFYNEEKNVNKVLKDTVRILDENKINYEIIAVNNGSWDKTSFLIDQSVKKNKKIKKVTVKKNQGYGWGVISGLNEASGDLIGWIYGDDQINSEFLLQTYNFAQTKDRKGIFKIKRIQRFDGFQRKTISKIYNLIMKILFDVDTADVNGCPKLFDKELFKKMNIQSKDLFIDSEILIKAKRHKVKIWEIPAVFKMRTKGKSSVKLCKAGWEFFKNMTYFYFKRKI